MKIYFTSSVPTIPRNEVSYDLDHMFLHSVNSKFKSSNVKLLFHIFINICLNHSPSVIFLGSYETEKHKHRYIEIIVLEILKYKL